MQTNLFLSLDQEFCGSYMAILNQKSKRRFRPKQLLSLNFAGNSTQIKSFEEDFTGQSITKKAKNIAIINVRGVLDYSSSIFHYYFGGSSYEDINLIFNKLLADSSVETIIFNWQSPGGSALGASELSEKIYNARNQKRIISFADPYAFSAAYQIGSAASEFYTVPSGMVGSVGSYAQHVEYSQMLKQDGIAVTYIYAGAKKVDGNASEPLSKQAKADIQEEVNELYAMFVNDLARNFSVDPEYVKKNFGQGGRVLAKTALSVGMISGITSLENLLANEAQKIDQVSSCSMSNQAEKHRFNNAKRFLELESLK
jgi:signal peptide peptidase SppA